MLFYVKGIGMVILITLFEESFEVCKRFSYVSFEERVF